MLKHLKRLFVSSTKTVYPDKCPFCNKLVDNCEIACENCKKDIPTEGVVQGICGGYRCASTLVHTDKFKRALINFKFKGKTQYAPQLAKIMYDEVNRSYPDMIFDVITYVPMHKRSLFFRGYNQSQLLAENLASLLKLPCIPLLKKTKHTKPQHKLSAKERSSNLKGAFSAIDKTLVKNKNILLVDDIVTTGSTLAECIKTLNKAKPMNIYCVTLSRAQYS